jgi:hypothetical protein
MLRKLKVTCKEFGDFSLARGFDLFEGPAG